MKITRIGLDLAKNVFQVFGVDAHDKRVLSRQRKRKEMQAFFQALPACLIGMEACASAHYWAWVGSVRNFVFEANVDGFPASEQGSNAGRCARPFWLQHDPPAPPPDKPPPQSL